MAESPQLHIQRGSDTLFGGGGEPGVASAGRNRGVLVSQLSREEGVQKLPSLPFRAHGARDGHHIHRSAVPKVPGRAPWNASRTDSCHSLFLFANSYQVYYRHVPERYLNLHLTLPI